MGGSFHGLFNGGDEQGPLLSGIRVHLEAAARRRGHTGHPGLSEIGAAGGMGGCDGMGHMDPNVFIRRAGDALNGLSGAVDLFISQVDQLHGSDRDPHPVVQHQEPDAGIVVDAAEQVCGEHLRREADHPSARTGQQFFLTHTFSSRISLFSSRTRQHATWCPGRTSSRVWGRRQASVA